MWKLHPNKTPLKIPIWFDIDKIFNDDITNHNQKYYFFLIKCDFILIINNDFSKPIHIETNFYHNILLNNLKRYFLDHIESLIDKGHIFSHTDEMNILNVNAKRYMTYDNYINHPLQEIELKLNMIVDKNPHLINSQNRLRIHPLIRRYSRIGKKG